MNSIVLLAAALCALVTGSDAEVISDRDCQRSVSLRSTVCILDYISRMKSQITQDQETFDQFCGSKKSQEDWYKSCRQCFLNAGDICSTPRTMRASKHLGSECDKTRKIFQEECAGGGTAFPRKRKAKGKGRNKKNKRKKNRNAGRNTK